MPELVEQYRITLACDGVSPYLGKTAAADITEEFTHRPWQQHVICTWDGKALILRAENDFDPEGLATMDEFSDAISACTPADFGYSIRLVSVSRLATPTG
jgi:hypothetical protein